jgi:hypothetical protein
LGDGTALLAFNAFVAKVSEGRVAMNASFDSTKVEARERAATSGEKAAALEAARVRAEIADGKADPNALALQRRRDAQKNIDPNRRRGGDAAKLSATEAERRVRIVLADKARYRARSGVERVNGHLHDAHGGRFVRVRGAKKVFLHLLLGLLVIAVEQASAIL